MKNWLILLGLLNVHIVFAQEHESQLTDYMAGFKQNIYFEDTRASLLNKVQSLIDIMDIELRSMESFDPQYQGILNTRKKAEAFYKYGMCFTERRGDIPFTDFDYINNLLGITVREIPELSSTHVIFYELRVDKFKAIFIHNTLIPKDFDYKTIKVDFDCNVNGKVFSGNSINVGGSKVRCTMYQSDTKSRYYPIVSVRCSEIKSNLPNTGL